MSKLIVLKIGKGCFDTAGFPVSLDLGEIGKRPDMGGIHAQLPPFPFILQYYKNWRISYNSLGNWRQGVEIPPISKNWLMAQQPLAKLGWRKPQKISPTVKRFSKIEDCRNLASAVSQSFNTWLESPEFQPIKNAIVQYLQQNLQPGEEIILQIQTDNLDLRRLPWRLWNLIVNDYPQTEISFSLLEYGKIPQILVKTARQQVRILVILGNDIHIDVEKDLELLKQELPDAFIYPLIKPEKSNLNQELSNGNWDILFFAGHSTSSDNINNLAYFEINETETLTIEDLKNSLQNAITKGLQLAIFNSCDGLKLAQDLENLQLPATVVMNEKIHDAVAQKFLEYFLKEFGQNGRSIHTAVKLTRKRLHDLEEKEYPCASWLPTICEHPNAANLTWHKLGGLPPCPYRGLAAFSEADAPWFFGRESLSEKLLAAVEKKKLVALVGPSGSGKSSVVFAGLIPRLKELAKNKNLRQQIIVCRPVKDAFTAVAELLLRLVPNEAKSPAAIEEFARQCQTDTNSLSAKIVDLMERNGEQRLLLVIDQFEELYNSCPLTQQAPFLESLVKTIDLVKNFTLVVTLRADFLDKALAHRDFGGKLEEYGLEIITQMKPEELAEAIAKPAQNLGVELEAGLSDRLLSNFSQISGCLPMLQFTLTELWLKQKDGQLSHATYQEMGEVKESLSKHAEKVYSQLSDRMESKRLKQIFMRLVNSDNTRRLATIDEIGKDNWDLVTYLADKRLVVTGKTQLVRGIETVEIIHEVLIEKWKTLQKWIKTEQAFLQWREEFEKQFQRWQEHNCSAKALLQGIDLAPAVAYLKKQADDLTAEEQKFIRLSSYRHNCRFVPIILTLAVGLGLSTLFGIFAFQQWQLAEANRREAEAKKNELEISNINLNAKDLLSQRLHLDGLVLSLTASRKILSSTSQDLRLQVAATLQQGLYKIEEKQRWEAHDGVIFSIAYSPDGKTMASAGDDSEVKIWSLEGIVNTFSGHQELVFDVRYSPDGEFLASASYDDTVKVWRIKDGTLVRTLSHDSDVLTVSYSPDGKTIVTGSKDGTIRQWKADDDTLINSWVASREPIVDVSYSPDGQVVASAGWDNTGKIWDIDGNLLMTLTGHEDQINSISFSPDGQLIATGSADKTIRIWERNGRLKQILTGHKGYVYAVTFSPDGQKMASADKDGAINLWQRNDNSSCELYCLIESFSEHTNSVNSLSFSPDGNNLVSASADSTIRVWQTSPQQILAQPGGIRDVAFISDRQLLVTANKNGTVSIRDFLGQEMLNFPARANNISICGDSIIATANDDKTIKLWSLRGELLNTLQGHKDKVFDVSCSPQGNLIASASTDTTVILWDIRGNLLRVLDSGQGKKIWSVNFSPDGQMLVAGGEDGVMELWDVRGNLLTTLRGHNDDILSVIFSPDGQMLASASQDRTIKLWASARLHFPQNPLILKGHSGTVNSFSFSADGKFLVSGSDDDTVRIWNYEGKLLATLSVHEENVNSVSFSSDRSFIVSGGNDGLGILSLDLDDLKERSCNWLNDYLKYNQQLEVNRQLCQQQ